MMKTIARTNGRTPTHHGSKTWSRPISRSILKLLGRLEGMRGGGGQAANERSRGCPRFVVRVLGKLLDMVVVGQGGEKRYLDKI